MTLYLDDLTPGRRFVTASQMLDEAGIIAFAAQFDPQYFHLDSEAAKDSLFGGLVASGWQVAGISMRLLVAAMPISGGIIGTRGEIEWRRPSRPGDTLSVSAEVLSATPSKSRPDRGTAVVRMDTRNQSGETVQTATMTIVVRRRAASDDIASPP
jgi:acyl dehydratase